MSSPELDKAVEIEIMTEDISAKSMFCCALYTCQNLSSHLLIDDAHVLSCIFVVFNLYV